VVPLPSEPAPRPHPGMTAWGRRGRVVAAVVLGILNTLLQPYGQLRMVIYAIALILIMIFRPGGLLGTWELRLGSLLTKNKAKKGAV